MEYNLCKQQFNVGDFVWLLRNHWQGDAAISKAKITYIDMHANIQDPENGFIFYTVEPLDITWIEKAGNTINYQLNKLFGVKRKLPWKYPGHGLLPGDNIFDSLEEAQQALAESEEL